MADRPALEARGLRVTLRHAPNARALVRGMDLALPPGEITGLAGASGSGKTLSALALMGLADPATFTVRCDRAVLGDQVLDLAAGASLGRLRGRRLAMVFQDPATALDPVFTLGAQLRRALRRLPGVTRADADRRARLALAEVGFPEPEQLARRYPHELSGGMRQLCVIAMAQAMRPEVLLADEPTTALDASTQAIVLHQLERLAAESGTAVLLITHDLRLLSRYARRVLVMREGRIVEETTGRGLHEAPRHAYTRALLAALPGLEGRHRRGESLATDTEAPLLAVRGLRSGYAGHRSWLPGRDRPVEAVRGVSLDLHPGRMHGLAGESGSGKSTLARTLVGLVPASGGSVRLDGREVVGPDRAALREARRRIQLVFQDPATALSPRRTIAQTLREPARHFGLDDSEARLVSVLEAVGLDASALPRLPRQFSSGQRQRIAIARALVSDPDLLVADEALASLDVSVQAQVLEVLRTLRDERGMAVLLISHDLAVLRENADDVSVMYRGHLVEQAPTEQLFRSPAHPYTRQLLAAMARLDPVATAAPVEAGAGLAPPLDGPGCVFRARCTDALPRCERRAPPRLELPGALPHRVECHLHDPDRSPGDDAP